MDGLRAFAILPVLYIHFAPVSGIFSFALPASRLGWAGVDLFFVLSGFLITNVLLSSLDKPHYYRNFVMRRALRILPLYYLAIVIYTLGARFAGGGSYWAAFMEWGGPAWYIFYVGNFRMAALNSYPPAMGFLPFWSLQVEEQFYLFYPFVVRRWQGKPLWRFLIVCTVSAPLLRAATLAIGNTEIARYSLTPLRMDCIAVGALVALAYREGTLAQYRRRLQAGLVLGALVFGIVVAGHGPENIEPMVQVVGFTAIDVVFACLLGIILISDAKSVAFLRWGPLVYTGQIAYGLYILHPLMQWLGRTAVSRFMPCEVGSTTYLVVAMVSSFAGAALSWRFFEPRFLALKDRFGSG